MRDDGPPLGIRLFFTLFLLAMLGMAFLGQWLFTPVPSGALAPFCYGAADRAAFCVVDGDTFWIAGEKIRIENIDAPESHQPACDAERDLAARATLHLRRLLGEPSSLAIVRSRPDGLGRTLARVVANGRDAGEAMIAEGVAVPWAGKRHDWCGVDSGAR